MTRPVEELEISALIDGELDPTRAAEVRSASEQDPVLHAQFLRLVEVDRILAGAASSAQFMPAVRWEAASPSPSRAHAWIVPTLVVVLVVGRLAPKVLPIDLAAAILVHGLILVVIIAVVLWISRQTEPQRDSPVAISS